MTTIVLSAGGTGGHLFPAQALARELGARGRSVVVMTDARGRNYDSVFPGARIEQVSAATFAGSIVARAMAPLRILAGILAGVRKLARLRPAAVVGFGGYPSLPVIIAAQLRGLPTAIHEQNAVLGRANRLLAGRAKSIAASLPLSRFVPKAPVVYTGNPVRPEAVKFAGSPYHPPLTDGSVRLLVFGGSQGAKIFSDIVPRAIATLPARRKAQLEIVQQCRPEDIAQVQSAYSTLSIRAEVAEFFGDLPKRMAAAQLVIARSGASTVSELTVIGRPAILIPFPFATDDHQTANAKVLANAGAAWLVPQRELTPQFLAQMLEQILSNPAELSRRARAALGLAKRDAAQRLADLVDSLAEAA